MTQVHNYLTNYNLNELKCCGNIYMIENTQLIFYCRLCTTCDGFDEFVKLFQHYVQEHSYEDKFNVGDTSESDDDLLEFDYDDTKPLESEIFRDPLEPIEQVELLYGKEPKTEKPESIADADDNLLQELEAIGEEQLKCKQEAIEDSSDPIDDEDLGKLDDKQSKKLMKHTEKNPNLGIAKVKKYNKCHKNSKILHSSEIQTDQQSSKPQKLIPEPDLSQHYTKHENGYYTCNSCDRSYVWESRMKQHVQNHVQTASYSCEICGRAFKNKTNLTQHVRRHNGDRPLQCPECPKRFYQQTELNSHLNHHRGIKPFMCYTCGNTFLTSSKLTMHMRRHTNDRRFECDRCDKKFFSTAKLKSHMATHLNERSHRCDQCSASFNQRKNLVAHQKLHANLREYVCSICNKGFNQQPGLAIHLRNTHNIGSKRNEDVLI